MSFSEPSTVPMRRKRTDSERVTNNGDPLVVRKKAREAEKSKKTTQVFFKKIINKIKDKLTYYILESERRR